MITEAARLIARSERCVVLTGAGISAESNVPTFRGKEGLWGKFKPEELATMNAFLASPKIVWEWYNWRRELIASVRPNPGHYSLWTLGARFEHFTLVTQNVDGLHTMAWNELRRSGSVREIPSLEDLLELHGNIMRNKCATCGRQAHLDEEVDPARIPTCGHCGGMIRPDVVWFGEMLDPDVIDRAFVASEAADLFLIVGTSALVHPAASLPVTAWRNGAKLIEINPEETPLSMQCDISIRAKSGEILPAIEALLGASPVSANGN